MTRVLAALAAAVVVASLPCLLLAAFLGLFWQVLAAVAEILLELGGIVAVPVIGAALICRHISKRMDGRMVYRSQEHAVKKEAIR